MDSETWRRIEELFQRAVGLGVDEQRSLLEEVGAESPEIGREVAEMLAAHGGETPLAIEHRLLVDGVSDDDEAAGSEIGGYRVERLLGQGGMGRVYLAHRVDADYDQIVALKLVRPSYRAAELVDRFRTELGRCRLRGYGTALRQGSHLPDAQWRKLVDRRPAASAR